MKPVFDPHIHLFDLQRGDYFWLRPENPPAWPDKTALCRNTGVEELALAPDLALIGAVHIEAGFDNARPRRELDWLSEMGFSFGPAISFADVSLPAMRFAADIAGLEHPLLAGIRHITEGNDRALLNDKNVPANLTLLAQKGLIFEAQFEVSCEATSARLVELARALPELQVVLNHAGLVCKNDFAAWRENIALIATAPNIAVKASGWEMADRHYDQEWVSQVVTILLELFGEDRVMLASNFPLCRLSCSYRELWQMYSKLGLAENIWRKVSHDNARRIYLAGLVPKF